jgi:hypothetical protein
MIRAMTYTTAVALWLVVLIAAAPAGAAPFAMKKVMCGTTECGTMVIDKYGEPRKNTTEDNKNIWDGGITIDGEFKKDANYLPEFHYLQAVLIDDSPSTHWGPNAVSERLLAPYLDAPPFGYVFFNDARKFRKVGAKQDELPWYDNRLNPLPRFIDKPGDFLLFAKDLQDGLMMVEFETWLVCVIEQKFIDDKDTKNDSWKVAPLAGWTWGFSIKYDDVGNLGVDEAADFTVFETDFAFIDTPSNGWKRSLTHVYTTELDRELFDVTLGACEDCKPTPEPSTLLMLLAPVGLLWARRAR